ncbi:MAG TPA: autoinducer binding domain-containing protein [Burkholderiaceae bacterium]|nr:autoinducer binding domain-containing protein [Burkholderiaceae bacterium]
MQGVITFTRAVPQCGSGHDDSECEQAMARFAARQGFEHCLYLAHVYPPMTRPTVIQAGHCPEGWQQVYASQNLSELDPWIRHAQGHGSPWFWDSDCQSVPAVFWQEALRHGMRHGCTLPVRTEHGIIGAMTFARARQPVSLAEYAEKAGELQAFCQDLHAGLLKRRLPQLFHRPDSQLSERERTILKWTADGKTSSEIALILGLTKRTINFHVAKATLKLNSTNKTQAALKAAVLGMLF